MNNYTCQIEEKNKHSDTYGGEIFEKDFFTGYRKPTSMSSQLPRSPIAGKDFKGPERCEDFIATKRFLY